MNQLIQVFEFETLKANDTRYFTSESIGLKVMNTLWQYNDTHHNMYFEGVRNGVRFKNYVGVLQVGSVTIEILPKADKNIGNSGDKKTWHTVLLHMLAKCKRIKVDAVSDAALRQRNNSLLDLYFGIFIQEVNMLLGQGLVKQYRKYSGNIKALKGQLQFSQHIQQNSIHKERFFTKHQVYDQNHLINQILYQTLLVLKQMTHQSVLSDAINRTLFRFPEMRTPNITKSSFSSLKLGRKTASYAEALKISKMILFNYSPDIRGGSEQMLALLFDMNKLWEEYVYRALAKYQNDCFKVSFQNGTKFWEHKRIKPDIVIQFKKMGIDNTWETVVIDTKWKMIDPAHPSDADLKQMYAYNMYWNAPKSMLLYPTNNHIVTTFGNFHKGRPEDNQCKLGFVEVLKDNKLNADLARDIIHLLDLGLSIN